MPLAAGTRLGPYEIQLGAGRRWSASARDSVFASYGEIHRSPDEDAMVLGDSIGPYSILAKLGEGGMGEVYRARDTKLNRTVAIKVLPDLFTGDADRVMRFRREAQVLAAINHPNIAHLYGLEEADGHPALVMELVEGPTLADRLHSGPLPLTEALPIARQIAEALEAAHEQGIVHRDLKPANIKIRDDGVAKVLDFGLARAGVADEGSGSSHSPTITSPALTQSGVLLGTAAYMAPEQARGKVVDKRADVWAFGCVLYEMLTGKRPFEGESLSDTLASILTHTPDWSALPRETPSHVRQLLQRCLAKDVKQRLRDIGEARIQLDEKYAAAATTMPLASTAKPRGWQLAVTALGCLAIGATASLFVKTAPTTSVLPVMRTSLALPDGVSLSSQYPLAISPDGATIAYVGRHDLQSDLYVQPLSAAEPRLIAGASNSMHPFFSPDGQWIGFFADGALQRVASAGGAPIRIAKIDGLPDGGSWGSDGTIVFGLRGSGLWKISSGGSAIEAIANTQPGAFPEFLPGGTTILFSTGTNSPLQALATIALDGTGRRIIARTSTAELPGPPLLGTGGNIAQGRFVPAGFIVYGQAPGFIRALPVDPQSLTPAGSPIPLVDSVEHASNGGTTFFSLSAAGTLFYAGTGEGHQLVWVDRAGVVTPISADRAAFREPQLSPDGRKVVVAINDETRRSDLWLYDVDRGTRSRLTTSTHNLQPQWTPDGSRITFGAGDLTEIPPSGGDRTVLMTRDLLRKTLTPGTNAYPTSWSPDGERLLVQGDNQDLFIFSRRDRQALQPLLVRTAQDWSGDFSPNGRWITWTSTESGRPEVYVAPVNDVTRKVVISSEGGIEPRWSKDGRELFFKRGDTMMAASIIESGAEMRSERPRALFSGSFEGTGRDATFDVAPDGRRFVMIKSDQRSTLRQLTVVQNWRENLVK